MFASIISAIIGFYMTIFATLFGGPTDTPVATSTSSSFVTQEDSAPVGPDTPAKGGYAQARYYSQNSYLPVSAAHDKLVATVVSGSTRAPLTVKFSGEVSSTGYSIEYGDGHKSGPVNCRHLSCPPTPTSSIIKKVSHTYQKPGTYVAKLRRHFTTEEADCAGTQCNIVATVTIKVTDPDTVCVGYKDGNLYDYHEGETTTVIPGGYLEKGYFLCSDGTWQQRE